MSQMTSLLKALKHCEKVSVLVATATVAVRNAHAPVGSGASTSPVPQQFYVDGGTESSDAAANL